MPNRIVSCFVYSCLFFIVSSVHAQKTESLRIPSWTHNHLLNAKITSKIESYEKGLRGSHRDMIYDFTQGKFEQKSSWSEYGIGAGQSVDIIQESSPILWMASWEKPIAFNFIQLSGCYPNQPQPNTAWKTEYVSIDGPDDKYRWIHSDSQTNVRLIREIDQQAMKEDIFNTLKGTATNLDK